MSDVTRILNAIEGGDGRAADELLPLVYEELRLLAAQKLSQEPPGQTLQATALAGCDRMAVHQLLSSAVITDGDWHRVGMVWEDQRRTLYVDDVEVARDAQVQGNTRQSTGGMHIGTTAIPIAPLFWSGLIDDVRIYNRPVRP